MTASRGNLDDLRDLAVETFRDARDLAGEGIEAVVDFLDSPEGRRLRALMAAGLVAAAPVVTRLPLFRATRLGRFVGFAGGAALIVKAAEVIRDWEPRRPQALPAGDERA